MKSDGTGEEGKVVARHARPRSRNLLREALEFVVIIVAALVLTVLIRTFVLDQYEIPTGSMQPTIEINDRVFAEKVSYHFSAV